MAITAAELMAKLSKDKEFQARKTKSELEMAELEKLYRQDEQELVHDINNCGFNVQSVWDFVNSTNNYNAAIPVLIKHLKIKHHPKILAGLVRSLAMKSLANNNELWITLVELYNTTLPNEKIPKPEERGAQEAIAVALEQLANISRLNDLQLIVKQNPNGDGIHWLKDKLNSLQI